VTGVQTCALPISTVSTTDSGAFRSRASLHQPVSMDSGIDLSVSALSGQRNDFFFGPVPGTQASAFLPAGNGLRSGTAQGKIWYGAFTLQAQAVARDRSYQMAAGDEHLIDRRAFAEARYEPKLGEWGELLLRGSFD